MKSCQTAGEVENYLDPNANKIYTRAVDGTLPIVFFQTCTSMYVWHVLSTWQLCEFYTQN